MYFIGANCLNGVGIVPLRCKSTWRSVAWGNLCEMSVRVARVEGNRRVWSRFDIMVIALSLVSNIDVLPSNELIGCGAARDKSGKIEGRK